MKVKLAYGKTGLVIDVPEDRTTVVQPQYLPGLPDQYGAIRTAIRDPVGGVSTLRRTVGPSDIVAISVCDITRPMPTSTVLPVVLEELAHVPDENVVILIATGTHRPNSADELRQMLGSQIVDSFTVVNHDAFDPSGVVHVGDTPGGVPVLLNRLWTEADVRVTLGFVEPHFFAGFSGGPKMVAPGLAAFETTMMLHNAEMIGHPNATWGVTVGNPIHDAIRQIAEQTGVDFSVEVTLNREHQITSVYAGDPATAHRAASRFAKSVAMQQVDEPFDVVVTTNSGYPLDMNLYQSVKGMSAAAQVVRRGGTIICAAECSDGVPDHGEYSRLLRSRSSPEKLLEMICAQGHNVHDQWQVQIQAQIQLKAHVLVKTGYLSEDELRGAHLEPVEDVERAVRDQIDATGPEARLCVIPEGPQTIPYLG